MLSLLCPAGTNAQELKRLCKEMQAALVTCRQLQKLAVYFNQTVPLASCLASLILATGKPKMPGSSHSSAIPGYETREASSNHSRTQHLRTATFTVASLLEFSIKAVGLGQLHAHLAFTPLKLLDDCYWLMVQGNEDQARAHLQATAAGRGWAGLAELAQELQRHAHSAFDQAIPALARQMWQAFQGAAYKHTISQAVRSAVHQDEQKQRQQQKQKEEEQQATGLPVANGASSGVVGGPGYQQRAVSTKSMPLSHRLATARRHAAAEAAGHRHLASEGGAQGGNSNTPPGFGYRYRGVPSTAYFDTLIDLKVLHSCGLKLPVRQALLTSTDSCVSKAAQQAAYQLQHSDLMGLTHTWEQVQVLHAALDLLAARLPVDTTCVTRQDGWDDFVSSHTCCGDMMELVSTWCLDIRSKMMRPGSCTGRRFTATLSWIFNACRV